MYIRQAMSRKRCSWRLRRQYPADSIVWLIGTVGPIACMECRQLIGFEAKREAAVVDSNNLGKP